MFVKVLAVLGFVAAASAADLSVGVAGAKLIFEKNVTASPAIWRQAQNLTVNATIAEEVIGRVIVIDNRPEKDGEAKVVEGGEGQKNVTIELKSPAVFRGFDFSIKVFAAENNMNARSPNHPAATGSDTQIPQEPKDLNVNDNLNQEPKNGDDIILGAPTPTAASSTEANKDDQDKINHPALVAKDQTRLYRDTEDQKPKDQTSVPTPVNVDATKDIKVNENANKTEQSDIDENLKKALNSILVNNSTHKTEDSDSQKVLPVMPAEDEDSLESENDEENRKVRQIYFKPSEPTLTKDVKADATTPKGELSSTTAKTVGQEKAVPRVVSITTEASSTTSSEELTTEFKLPSDVKKTSELERNTKGHHFGHHHAVPLPYVN